jgi:Spy/CpxP family protein refolding chaperone
MLDFMLRQRDSLKLTPAQVDSLNKLNGAYQMRRDTIYTQLSIYLASRHGEYAGEEVRQQWHDALVKVFVAQNDLTRAMADVLTPEQRNHMPLGMVARMRSSASDVELQFRTPMTSPP